MDSIKIRNKKNEQVLSKIFSVSFMLIMGILAGIWIASYNDRCLAGAGIGSKFFAISFMLIGLWIVMVIQVAIHELGHLIFGLMTGYKFISYRIGSFMWSDDNGKIKFGRYSLAGTGGQCIMAPPDLEDGKMPTALYNLGGCIMNIVASCIFFVLSFVTSEHYHIYMFLIMGGCIGVMSAIMNFVPMTVSGVDNDGKNTLTLMRHPEAVRGLWLQLKIAEMNTKGVRIKDMPEEWFEIDDDKISDNGLTASVAFMKHSRYIDMHEFEKATDYADSVLLTCASMPGIYRNMLVCDRLYCELIGKSNLLLINELADKGIKNFVKSMKKNPSVIRVKYTYSLASGNHSEAEEQKRLFEEVAKTYPYPCEIQGERELMDTGRERLTKVI